MIFKHLHQYFALILEPAIIPFGFSTGYIYKLLANKPVVSMITVNKFKRWLIQAY